MNDPEARALGRKIAFHRSQKGWSQREFGALIQRSETWVSQVERGVRRIDRMTVLRRVSDVLEVPLSELAANTPIVAAAHRRPEPATALRLLLSSSLALGLAVEPVREEAGVEQMRADAGRAWDLAHRAEYDELIPLLVSLVAELETAVRVTTGDEQRIVLVTLAKTYHAGAAALSKLGEIGAAWVAADRAIAAADRAGDRLLMAEGAFRLTLVFQNERHYDQAQRTASTAADALQPLVEAGQLEAISLQGALYLQLAVTAARQNDITGAYAHLQRARHAADALGADRNDYDTEFGPTNVSLHEVAVAIEVGDAGTALRVAAGIDASHLSPERHGRLLLDVARANLQRRHIAGTIQALLSAEKISPEQVRQHRIARDLLRDLARAGHGADPRVAALNQRCGPSNNKH